MANGVDVVDTENPFVLRELDFSAKVVQMPDQGAEDLSVSGFCLGAHEVDDMLCKVGVEFAGIIFDAIGAVGTIRSHDNVMFLLRGSEEGCCRDRFWRGENKQ